MNLSPEFQRMLARALAAPRLTYAEEVELFESGRMTELLQCNLRYAWHWAFRMRGYVGTPLEDLFQVACMGMLEALRSWDSSRGVLFRSWAWHRATKQLYSQVANDWRIVRDDALHRSSVLFKFRRRVSQLYGRTDRDEVLKSEFKMNDETLVRALMACDASEDVQPGLDWELELEHVSPEDLVLMKEEVEVLREELTNLNVEPRDKEILLERFLQEDEPTLREVAASRGLSHEGVRLIVNQTKLQLQRQMESRYA